MKKSRYVRVIEIKEVRDDPIAYFLMSVAPKALYHKVNNSTSSYALVKAPHNGWLHLSNSSRVTGYLRGGCQSPTTRVSV